MNTKRDYLFEYRTRRRTYEASRASRGHSPGRRLTGALSVSVHLETDHIYARITHS